MGACQEGFPSNDFFENLNHAVTVVRDGHLIGGQDGFSYAANAGANVLTGYYSDKARCNLSPGALPGHWKTPLVWESYCHGTDVHREITLLELLGNACGAGSANFCESLVDLGGNKRKPIACGGSDPNLYEYNPATAAQTNLKGTFAGLESDSNKIAEEFINDGRKKIFAIALVVLVVVVLIYLIYK